MSFFVVKRAMRAIQSQLSTGNDMNIAYMHDVSRLRSNKIYYVIVML